MMVKHKSYRLKNGKQLYIFPLSDLHLGSPNCNIDYFHYWAEIFEKTPKNKIIYCLGDLIDFQSLKVGAFDTTMTADNQIIKLIELLKPYKKYINYMTIGNHAKRPRKDYNLDVGHIIADSLEVPYNRSEFFDTLRINGKEFVVYGKHGTKFSSRIELAEGGMVRDTSNIRADLLMQGHNHYCKGFSRPITTKDGIKRKYYGFTGHFLSYRNSYANERNMPHNPEGFLRYNINGNCIVGWNEYHIDERKNELLK